MTTIDPNLQSLLSGSNDSTTIAAVTRLINALVADAREGDGEQETESCSCGDNDGEESSVIKKQVDGEFSVKGDPHVEGKITLDGKEVTFNYTTVGGSDKYINMLNTDNLDIKMKFDDLKPGEADVEGVTFATEATFEVRGDTETTSDDVEIAIDADDDSVTVNGKEIEDGTCTIHGNKITKEGDTITILTAGGEKIVVEDKGKYLDTTGDFSAEDKPGGMETSELSGMLGDSINGVEDDEAKQADNYVTTQSSSWAKDCCDIAAGQIDDEEIVAFLNALSGLIEAGNGNFDTSDFVS